jgi:hypothetical protein
LGILRLLVSDLALIKGYSPCRWTLGRVS